MAEKRSKKNSFKAHQFKPGQSGNPKGRRKRDAVIDEFFEGVFHTTDGPVERREALMLRLFTSALDAKRKDHAQLLGLALGYCYGKPKDRVEMSGPGGAPIATEDATPGRRPTTGDLRKRFEALMAKREAHLATKKAQAETPTPAPENDPEEPQS